MEEIKIRAWSLSDEPPRMMEWTELSVELYTHLYELGDKDNYEWMLYIGRKDKNEKEMYEGDLVRYGPNIIYEIHFKHGCFTDQIGVAINSMNSWEHEVIGNKYENPELRKL